MALLLYQLLGTAAVAVLLLAAPFVPAVRRGLASRLGLGARGARGPGCAAGETVWLHAASVGEVRAAAPLVAALLQRRPGCRVLLSTFTVSGLRLASQAIAAGEPRVRCRLLPLDWGWFPAQAVRRERPALFVPLETELWPVLLTALRRAGVPVLIANGRISARSFGRYRLLRAALAPALRAVTLALARTAEDAERYVALGIDPARVRVAGNLKHSRGREPDRDAARRQDAIRQRLGGGSGRPVLVAGSIRGAEVGIILEAFAALRVAQPGLLLVLAPRHPERFEPRALDAWNGSWRRWSSPGSFDDGVAVVLLDTIGELSDVYAAATVSCVGGSWAGHGGHNLLEPAFHGVPVAFGPDYRHFDDEARALTRAGGGFVAADAGALAARCAALLADRTARASAGRRAREVAATFGGAADAVVAAACSLLDARTRAR